MAPIFGSFYSEAFIGLDSWNDFYFLLVEGERQRNSGGQGVKDSAVTAYEGSIPGWELNCHKP